MIIVFGNQKGGAGKTTLAMLFANYLSIIKKMNVLVLDMDFQKSIYSRYKEEQLLDNIEPYKVLPLNLAAATPVIDKLKEIDQIVIIDLPGRLDDPQLVPILESADIFIIPFHYDKTSFHSTFVFNTVSKQYNSKAKKFFVPNRVKSTVKHETEAQVNNEFSKDGIVTGKISDSVAIQRTSTKDISSKVIPLIEKVFDNIIEEGKL